MKRVVLPALIAMVLPLSALAQGITNSRHDLSVASLTIGPKAVTETQTCVFCHVPHSALEQPLIWNHALPIGSRGWAAGQVTVEGTTLPAAILPDSMRCLSCHDGTVALGEVNNAGGGAPGLIAMSGPVGAGYLVGAGPPGNEMVNTHPVSIPYAGETANGIVSQAAADNALGNYFSVVNAGCEAVSGFCTSAPVSGTFINLKGGALGALAVECGTCHEPHNRYPNAYFLRATEVQSALCRACHNK